MNDMQKCGWNDIAHGIITWTPHEKWQTSLEWALYCKSIVEKRSDDHSLGVIKAVDHFQKTGTIYKQKRGYAS